MRRLLVGRHCLDEAAQKVRMLQRAA
jgi:hypothetical protein